MLSIGEVVLYKTYNKNGDVIRHGRQSPEIRKIIRFLRNTRGERIVDWSSDRASGICMVSIWEEWQDGVVESKRRGT